MFLQRLKKSIFKAMALTGISSGVLVGVPTQTSAQSEQMVTLNFGEGDGISGELLEFTGQAFKLDTLAGVLTIPAIDLVCIGNACPASTRLDSPLPSITLTGLDGVTQVSGQPIKVTETEYLIATEVGELRIDRDSVTCLGTGCPEPLESLETDPNVAMVNGDTRFEGGLLEYDEDAYILDVETLGQVRFSRSSFSCEGSACPDD